VGFENVKLPSFEGFWSSEVKMPDQVSLHKENVNGVTYNVAELKKTILFPQKSGTLTIEPMSVTAVVQVRTQGRSRTGDPFFDNFFNDPVFGSSVQNVRKEVRSAPVSVHIKPLPTEGQTASFGGAVGNFTIKASIDKTVVKANEALNYKITLSGSGNLELVDKLKIDFPSDFEVYDPKVNNSISSAASGVSGSRVFEYLVIPRNQGSYSIPPVKFSYYDLSKRTYVNLETEGYKINVEKGAGGSSASYSASSKEDVKMLGSDIRFVQTGDPHLRPIGAMFFQTSVFWILFVIPFLLFSLVILIWNRHMKLVSDQGLMKNRKATKVAKTKLKKASDYLKSGSEEAFYIEVSQALWGYLADKLYLPMSTLSLDTVVGAMEDKGVGEALRLKYKEVLEECEFIRFAPGDKAGKMDGLYRSALEVVTASEKEIS
ncbi:MAG: BatD family protein, partial [Bacteroidota bacterium]